MQSDLCLPDFSLLLRTPSNIAEDYVEQAKRDAKRRVRKMPRILLTNDELVPYTHAFTTLAQLSDTIDANLVKLFTLIDRSFFDELVTIITSVFAQRQRALFSRHKHTYILTFNDVVCFTLTLKSVRKRYSAVLTRGLPEWRLEEWFQQSFKRRHRRRRSVPEARPPPLTVGDEMYLSPHVSMPNLLDSSTVAGPSRLPEQAIEQAPEPVPTLGSDQDVTRLTGPILRGQAPEMLLRTLPPMSFTFPWNSDPFGPIRSFDLTMPGPRESSGKRTRDVRSPDTPTFPPVSPKKLRRPGSPVAEASDAPANSAVRRRKSKGKGRAHAAAETDPRTEDGGQWKPGMRWDGRRHVKRRDTLDSLRAAFDEDEYILRSIPEPKTPLFSSSGPAPRHWLAVYHARTLKPPGVDDGMAAASCSTDSLVPVVDVTDIVIDVPSPPSVVSSGQSSDSDSLFDEPCARRATSVTTEVVSDVPDDGSRDGQWIFYHGPMDHSIDPAQAAVEPAKQEARQLQEAHPLWLRMVYKTACSVFSSLQWST